jgi:DNA polymerase-4
VRTILHADLDAFYASVEQLDRPQLRGKPVLVGGPPEARGVVAAASYEARRFGVRSAMPMSRALRLCPQAVRVSPRLDRYAEVSRQVMSIFRSVTPLVEPLSLDEAFLDVSDQVEAYGGAEVLALRLKANVKEKAGLTVSIGIGANKTVAKIASDMRKPDGLVIVPPGEEAAFLAPLPVRALWGIGPRADETLRAAGFQTIGQIAAADAATLCTLLGSRGALIHKMARGEDDRPVVTSHERKSIGVETTFPRDLPHGPELRRELRRMAREVAARLRARNLYARTVILKLRYSNFKTVTRQTSQSAPLQGAEAIEEIASKLLDVTAGREERFRLLGVQCANLLEGGRAEQLILWQKPVGVQEERPNATR